MPQYASCGKCKKPFQFLEEIKSRISRSNTGARSVMQNAAERVQLYMGHEQRGYAQYHRITDVFKKMRLAEQWKELIIFINYTMKSEPI